MNPDSPQLRKKKRIPADFSPRELEIVRHIATGRTSTRASSKSAEKVQAAILRKEEENGRP